MAEPRPWSTVLRAWPMPAVLTWGGAWLAYGLLTAQGLAIEIGLTVATALGVAASLAGETWWRRLLIGSGFPLSLALSLPSLGVAFIPAWAWLLPLGLLLLIYPINAWRDAPLFPTPRDALLELPHHAPLPDGASVVDAGCGAGDGLRALRAAYPQAVLHGLEWSWPLRALSALRCPWARVRQGDIWRADWSAYDMVYLFQRPESMPRAVAKASELRAGAWMVSLEFEATELVPAANYRAPSGKMVWLYRAPLVRVGGASES
jgi:hypothetical protein